MEACCKASLLASLEFFSRHSSNPQPQQGRRLGVAGESMLQEMYLPGLNMVWTEVEIMKKMRLLLLVPHQQSALDLGIRLDQFSLDEGTQQF